MSEPPQEGAAHAGRESFSQLIAPGNALTHTQRCVSWFILESTIFLFLLSFLLFFKFFFETG